MSRREIGEVRQRIVNGFLAAPTRGGIALGFMAGLALLGGAAAAQPSATQTLAPSEISLGDSAMLTVTISGNSTAEVPAPSVAGLEFNAVGQSSRIQSINGVTSATASVTYQVTAHQSGVYTIPGPPGAQPVVLTVKPDGGSGAANNGTGAAGAGAAGAPPSSAGAPSMPSTPTQLAADGTAFVRLRLAKQTLYVGESIPVDIEVGLRDGLLASLNGPPVLNGDAFTLNPLPSKPESRVEIVEGKPFTVLTWHSLLSAVKPGSLSLTIETPLTVRLRTPRPGAGAGSSFDDPFDDPIFQNFFRGSFFNLTQKDITVSSAPVRFEIEPLPSEGRPASFSGAVGRFSVGSAISDPRAAAGDPLTLRLEVTGSGNFDRVRDSMLHDVPGWKTYDPTARFKPADEIGFSGTKVFEQPLIATEPGVLVLPPIEFSYFDPEARRYEEAHTAPLSVEITPAAAGSTVAQALHPAPAPPATAGGTAPADGLRPDHVETSGGARSLWPRYAEPGGLALPAALLLGFGLGAVFIARQPQARAARAARRARREQLATEPWLRAMERAQTRNDPDEFFVAASSFLKRVLAARWQMAPESVTLETVGARLGAESEVARVFKLADEARYARLDPRSIDLQHWGSVVRHQAGAGASA